jgi:alkylhydroperoxidase/carboxymuconolactone decarboxylase family protein YurZ
VDSELRPGSIAFLADLRPELAKPLEELVHSIYSDDCLDMKTRELVFLGIQAALRLPNAIAVHVPRAKAAGATLSEILSAMATSIPNAGMNGLLECCPVAVRCFDEQPT